ncbi:HXXEE domain-containing protein [Paenibacillus aurantius]|uniref:HXXEE domain-containing protein n=1 Tax=Paenibacillus aurantius TaxID=2918900 RepID=A0AA96LEE1_9BACL|nr:HXXEE domain-containing protein [Paenibacillus aurantius]WNQ12262.1 HXXEE domain-containing protein [Paenibacillus aurantius]
MFPWLNQVLSLHTVIWLLPIVFMFHDLEEIVTVEPFMRRNRMEIEKRLPSGIGKRLNKIFGMRTGSFAVAVGFMLLGVSFCTVWAGIALDQGGSLLPFAAALAVFFAHSFTHLGQSVLLRRYTPGVATAVLLVLPYSIYAYYRLFSADLLTWATAELGLLLGVGGVIPLLWLGHKTGTRLFKNGLDFE